MNLTLPSDPKLASAISQLWPIALSFPRIPVVRDAPAWSMKSGAWSDDELEFLRVSWPFWTNSAAIVEHLNRTRESVEKKAAQLRLWRPKRG